MDYKDKMDYIVKELSRVPSYDNPKTWDVTIGFNNDTSKDNFTVTCRFKSAAEIVSGLSARAQQIINNRLAELAMVPDKQMMESEVKSVLIEKGYLKVDETLEDLKPLSELIAETEAK
jgi:hypothetical protein